MDLKIGTIQWIPQTGCDHIFDRIASLGLHTCQLSNWDMSLYRDPVRRKESLRQIQEQMEAKQVRPCAFWAGYGGIVRWNFVEGPVTMGLVPAAYRNQRVVDLREGADFAKELGLPAIITHCGFIPENMTDGEFLPVVMGIAEVATYCKSLGIQFWFETGQETPVTLLRAIQRLEELGLDNLGINLDPANLLLYGKGNPIDALSVFGRYVRNIHVKDGCVPTDGRSLGPEKQVGQGMVNYPRFIHTLKEIGFSGEFIIEREIGENEEQLRDIRETMGNLEKWWNAGEK